MTLKRLLVVAAFLFLANNPAKADSAQVYVNGSYAFGSFGYGVGPYGGTLNGQNAAFYCVDFAHDIVGQSGWTATVTNLPTSTGVSLPGTLQGSSTVYLDMAWMISQMMGTSSQTLQAEYQWAIWSLSLGSNPSSPSNPYGTNGTLIANAQSAVNGGWSGGGWEILTPIGGTGYPGIRGYYGQEFLVHVTPEPGVLLLLLTGLVAMAIFARRK